MAERPLRRRLSAAATCAGELDARGVIGVHDVAVGGHQHQAVVDLVEHAGEQLGEAGARAVAAFRAAVGELGFQRVELDAGEPGDISGAIDADGASPLCRPCRAGLPRVVTDARGVWLTG